MSENTTTPKGVIEMTKKNGPHLKAVTEPAKGKATTEAEKAEVTARQVQGDVLDFRQQQPNQEYTMNESISNLELNRIKGECLAKYSERKPTLFFQIDCWGPNAAGDSIVDPHSSGKGMTAGSTWELMRGSPVRILIAEDYTDQKLLADMITEAAESIRRCPELLKEHYERNDIRSTTNVIEFPDPEICRRCGASMQATHHELCEARDGTPTDLDDATVRRLIRQILQRGDDIEGSPLLKADPDIFTEDEIPF